MVWLCTAITMAGASHTAHLLINGLMLSPAMGAIDMGMGSGVDSQ